MRVKKRSTLKTAGVTALALVLALAVQGCKGDSGKKDVEPWLKDYAANLADRGLHLQAAQAYEKYLETAAPDPAIAANLHYMIAEIYRDKLFDYDSALAHYLIIKHIDPNSELLQDIDAKIVECLEKSGRSVDAKLQLNRSVSVDGEGAKDGGNVVATIGDRSITDIELDRMISDTYKDPSTMTREEKSEFLRNKIAQELMANAGERKGYNKDAEMLRRIEEYRKSLVANKVFKEEVGDKTRVDPNTVRLYYDAHKEEFKDDKGNVKQFDEVSGQIYMKLNMEQQQMAAQGYIQRLLGAERVEIFDQNIKGAPPRPVESQKAE